MTVVKEPDGDRPEDLMRRYGDALVRMCCLYLNDASLAQDAAQDTFIKAWRNLGQFRGECDERTWLMRIAINTCRDYHRTAWLRHVDRGTPLEALPEAGAEEVVRVDYIREVSKRLESTLGRRVKLSEGPNSRGRITLEYYDADDREALIAALEAIQKTR